MDDRHLVSVPKIGELWEDPETDLIYIIKGYNALKCEWEVISLVENHSYGWKLGEIIGLAKGSIVGDICHGIVTTHE